MMWKSGCDTIIYPCTYLAAGTRIGKNCVIGPFAYLKNVRVKDGEKVIFRKEGSLISPGGNGAETFSC